MKLQVEYVKPDSLRAAPYNPRRIDRAALSALARLLDEHGFVVPVVARREDRLLIGGHQRIRANALRQKPEDRVPCVFLEGIRDAQVKALTVALNNPAAQGCFDPTLLGELLEELDVEDIDVPAATGLPQADIEALVAALEELSPEEPDTQEGPAAAEQKDTPSDVVVILEMAGETFRTVRPELDKLIARHGLTCVVRTDP